jgi:hypothetical protein
VRHRTSVVKRPWTHTLATTTEARGSRMNTVTKAPIHNTAAEREGSTNQRPERDRPRPARVRKPNSAATAPGPRGVPRRATSRQEARNPPAPAPDSTVPRARSGPGHRPARRATAPRTNTTTAKGESWAIRRPVESPSHMPSSRPARLHGRAAAAARVAAAQPAAAGWADHRGKGTARARANSAYLGSGNTSSVQRFTSLSRTAALPYFTKSYLITRKASKRGATGGMGVLLLEGIW